MGCPEVAPTVAAPVPAAESLNLFNVGWGGGLIRSRGGYLETAVDSSLSLSRLFECESFRVSKPETGWQKTVLNHPQFYWRRGKIYVQLLPLLPLRGWADSFGGNELLLGCIVLCTCNQTPATSLSKTKLSGIDKQPKALLIAATLLWSPRWLKSEWEFVPQLKFHIWSYDPENVREYGAAWQHAFQRCLTAGESCVWLEG